METLILVDGSSYLFRAFHALPPLMTTAGQPTGAIYGVLSMLKRLMQDYHPDYVAVVFDAKGGSFRNQLYDAYKANRIAMPDDLQVQIKPLHDAIKAMGFPLLMIDQVEADDVIGTLVKQAEQLQLQTIISTGDKDMAQLVTDRTTLINTMTNTSMDVAGVFNKFSVTPDQIIDYLTLVGDTSDNVPGVPKVGPKTAAKWLAEYKTLDNLTQHADKISGKVGEYFRDFIPKIPLTRQLVTIKLDVDLPCKPTDLKMLPANNEALSALFKTLEFHKWLEGMQDIAQPTKQPIKATQYEVIRDKATFATWLERLTASPVMAFDTETTSLNSMGAQLVGLSFAVTEHQAAYVPLTHDYLDVPEQLDRDWVLAQLKPLLTDPHKTIVGQNLKYDMKVLKHYGIDITAPKYDTLLESYVLNSAGRHDMDTLAKKYLDHDTVTFESIAGKGAKQLTFNQIDVDTAGHYAAEDADITLRLHHVFMAQLNATPLLKKVLDDIEEPLLPILTDMEYTGVLIDAKLLYEHSQSLEKRIGLLHDEVIALAGEPFNLDSPKQLQEILYDKLQLPILKKTPTGQPSTAEPVMQELSLTYPLPKLILEYRSLAKLKSTYTDSLPRQIDPKTGRVHTHYNQAGTSTGRLSSRDPNLQNIPVRNEEGRKIREAFIAPPGCVMLSADYSQIELRIMAHLSKDPGLVAAFEQGLDVHQSTAAEVFGVSLDAVTPELRRRAKAINFGLMYGMSAFGLAQQLGIDTKEAQEHMTVYFARYPSVQNYMHQARQLAAQHGYVETLLGRRVFVPDINSKQVSVRHAAERAAVNAPLQGTAADIIKLAMIRVDRWIKHSQLPVVLVMQVHDELLFEVHEQVLEEARSNIVSHMEHAVELSVPLVVDVGIGQNWGEAH